MINALVAKVFGTKNERDIKRLMPRVEAINTLEPTLRQLTDEQLRAKTDEFRQRIQDRLTHIPDEPDADQDRRKELDAQRTKGEGDAKASAIYAEAFGRDPRFAAFWRNLQAYRASFQSKSDVMVIDGSSEFFRAMRGGSSTPAGSR